MKKIYVFFLVLFITMFSACTSQPEKYNEIESSYIEKVDSLSGQSAINEASSASLNSCSSVGDFGTSSELSQNIEESSEKLSSGSDTNNENNVSETQKQSFAASLSAAARTDSIIVVSANGTTANVSLHEKENGVWMQLLSTNGYVGFDGVGQASEDLKRTPEGVYPIGIAFGVSSDPGVATGYTQVDDSYYWVDDVDSAYYNQFVSTNNVEKDWTSAEHIVDSPNAYAYCLDIGYNTECIPGAGSAMFLHCSTGEPTYGCVSIPKSDMVFVLTHIKSSTLFVIADEDDLLNY